MVLPRNAESICIFISRLVRLYPYISNYVVEDYYEEHFGRKKFINICRDY